MLPFLEMFLERPEHPIKAFLAVRHSLYFSQCDTIYRMFPADGEERPRESYCTHSLLTAIRKSVDQDRAQIRTRGAQLVRCRPRSEAWSESSHLKIGISGLISPNATFEVIPRVCQNRVRREGIETLVSKKLGYLQELA